MRLTAAALLIPAILLLPAGNTALDIILLAISFITIAVILQMQN